MIDVGKVVLIGCSAFLWVLSAGCVIAAALAFIGCISYIKDMVRETRVFDRKTNRDMAIIFGVVGCAVAVVSALPIMAALAVARGI